MSSAIATPRPTRASESASSVTAIDRSGQTSHRSGQTSRRSGQTSRRSGQASHRSGQAYDRSGQVFETHGNSPKPTPPADNQSLTHARIARFTPKTLFSAHCLTQACHKTFRALASHSKKTDDLVSLGDNNPQSSIPPSSLVTSTSAPPSLPSPSPILFFPT